MEKIETLSEAVGDYTPGEGERVYAVTVAAANNAGKASNVTWSSVEPKLIDANGEAVEWKQDLLSLSSNRTVETELKPGASVRGRFIFVGPATIKPASITLKDQTGSGRSIQVKF